MLSLADISAAIERYRSGSISIDRFEDWFRDNSRGMFGEELAVLNVCLAVESAFSSVRFGNATEKEFAQELAAAIRPFDIPDAPPATFWPGNPQLPVTVWLHDADYRNLPGNIQTIVSQTVNSRILPQPESARSTGSDSPYTVPPGNSTCLRLPAPARQAGT